MKVSVCITTYNHEPYIAQALDSVLDQEVDFDYEILVGEDDSSDRTREIVKAYAERYPDRIRLFLNDRENVIYINGRATGRYNWANNIRNAQGEYLVMLDGDDYWISNNKLQQQIDYLDVNLDCAICFHPVNQIEDENIVELKPHLVKQKYTFEELLKVGNFMYTSSVVARNYFQGVVPDYMYKTSTGDYPSYVFACLQGDIGYIDEIMSVYRVHKDGVWSKLSEMERLKNVIRDSELLMDIIPKSYRSIIVRGIVLRSLILVQMSIAHSNTRFLGTSLISLGKYPLASCKAVAILTQIAIQLLLNRHESTQESFSNAFKKAWLSRLRA